MTEERLTTGCLSKKTKYILSAASIIAVLVLFAIIGPMLANKNYVNSYLTDTMLVTIHSKAPYDSSFFKRTAILETLIPVGQIAAIKTT